MATHTVYKPTDKFKQVYTGGTLEPPKFMPSLNEWLRKKGAQKIQGGSVAVAGDYGIYTVPANYSLFITSVYLDTNLAAGVQAVWFLASNTTEKIIALNGVKAVAISYQIPILIETKKQMVLSTLGNGLVQYGFTGFLIKNSEIPLF
jgi:hypothetical protein